MTAASKSPRVVRRWWWLLVALALVAAACGGNDDDGGGDAAEPVAAEEQTDAPTEVPEEAPAEESADKPTQEPADESAETQEEEPAEVPAEPTPTPIPIVLTASYQGVTETEIAIGAAVIDLDQLVPFGIDLSPFPLENYYEALADDLNQRRGIHGRNVVVLVSLFLPIGRGRQRASVHRVDGRQEGVRGHRPVPRGLRPVRHRTAWSPLCRPLWGEHRAAGPIQRPVLRHRDEPDPYAGRRGHRDDPGG